MPQLTSYKIRRLGLLEEFYDVQAVCNDYKFAILNKDFTESIRWYEK